MVTAKKPAIETIAVAKKTPGAKSDVVVAKVPAVKKKTVAKPKSAESSPAKQVLSDEQRARYVEVAAFYIAERRGFAAGNPADDWLAAEAEVNRLMDSGHFPA
jgi:hypothetical protein